MGTKRRATVDLELTALIQTRVSAAAKQLVQRRATDAGVKSSTWVRQVLYRELGFIRGKDRSAS